METISLFEHQALSLVGDDIPLREQHLRQLDRLNRQAGVELVKLGYKQIRATSYVGVIQLGRVTLQILPKVDAHGQDDRHNPASVASAVANLLWLLVYAGELPIRENEVSALLKRPGDLFEILVRLFCERLVEQLEHGLHRTYQSEEETLPVLRGRWLLGRQLQAQPLLRDKFMVAYDEFNADNLLNRILTYTVHRLGTLTRDAGNRQRLDILRMWFDEVSLPSRVSEQDIERVVFTRLNIAYRPIFNLACMFLLQEALQLRAGQTEAFTFLFDMNLLFERFVTGFLHRHRRQTLLGPYQHCDILIQGRGDVRWLARTEPQGGRRVFRLKPDLLLRRPDLSIALVVDTKYKTHQVINEADAYQMHVYASRYECAEILLLYPEAQMTPQTLYVEGQAGQSLTRLRTHTINLRHNLQLKAERDNLARELAEALTGG